MGTLLLFCCRLPQVFLSISRKDKRKNSSLSLYCIEKSFLLKETKKSRRESAGKAVPLLPGQFPDPPVAPVPTERRDDFEDLIRLEEHDYLDHRQLPNKSPQKGEGHDDSPSTDQVGHKTVPGIAAAPDDPGADRHLVGHAHHHHAHDGHQLVSQLHSLNVPRW